MATMRLEAVRSSKEEKNNEWRQVMLEAAFAGAPLAILFIDDGGRVTIWNQKAGRELLPDTAREKPILFQDLFVDREELDFLLFSLHRQGGAVEREILLRTRDGQKTRHLINIHSLDGPALKNPGFLCFAGNRQEVQAARESVTEYQRRLDTEREEREQTEGALQQTTARLQEMVYEYGHRNREAKLLGEMSEFLQACQSPEETYPLIARFAGDLFSGTSGSLFMLNTEETVFEVRIQWGKPSLNVAAFSPQDCWAVRRGKLHQVLENDPIMGCRHMAGFAGAFYLCVPLINQGQTIGLLQIENNEEKAASGDDFLSLPPEPPDKKLAATFTDHLALALSNLRLKKKLHSLAIRDPLTGLYNRRYMEESLEREIHRARRKGVSLGILMVDIDHFKLVNDTHGHEAGDLLLKTLGDFLRGRVRADDIACRYGGEEFTLILPEITLERALNRAEVIRKDAPQLKVTHRGRQLEPITLSIGVALFPQDGMSWEDVLRQADQSLYRAKDSGRNGVFHSGKKAS